jgi:hypothetical protein
VSANTPGLHKGLLVWLKAAPAAADKKLCEAPQALRGYKKRSPTGSGEAVKFPDSVLRLLPFISHLPNFCREISAMDA